MNVKKTICTLPWLTTALCIIYLLVLRNRSDEEKQGLQNDLHNNSSITKDKVDVLLFGYARGGSTYVGHILGHSKNTFYFYEPLWTTEDGLKYFHNDQICEMNSEFCRSVTETKDYIKTLKSVYTCSMETFLNTYVVDWHRKKGGASWYLPNDPHNENVLLQRRCKNSKTRVAKVLRITGDSLSDLLSSNSNLKVVYLYRDPRGIVNSRLKLRSRPRWNVTMGTVKEIADGLCRKMYIDSKVIFRLNEKYPNRIFRIAYETIAKSPRQSIREIYNFLDVHISENYLNAIESLGKLKNAKDDDWSGVFRRNGVATAMKWQQELSVGDKHRIDESCASVYKRFGYKTF